MTREKWEGLMKWEFFFKFGKKMVERGVDVGICFYESWGDWQFRR